MQAYSLKTLHLVNFKNYPEAKIDFSTKINCFVGNNGVGKTNLLDAIYYLSTTKSYFNNIDHQSIKYDAQFCVIEGNYDFENREEKIYLGIQKDKKKTLKRNKKEYEKLSDHIGNFPVVMISPYDRDLITEGSETRRKFMDGVISQRNPIYLDNLIHYNKALLQRNRLLKYFAANRSFDKDTLAIYDAVLIDRGQKIYEERSKFMEEILPILSAYYEKISDKKDPISISYTSLLQETDFKSLLAQSLEKDLVLQFTSKGIHKDDLKFEINHHSLKKTGSQGQQKSFLISLKLAQFDFIKNQKKLNPILLLDDIFDKLDEERVKALIELVNEHHFGQIFISDTHADRTAAITKQINEEAKIIKVNRGGILQEEK